MKFLGLFFIMMLFWSCNAPRAVYDYDAQVNFEKFNTYDFYPDIKTGLSSLDENRLLESIEARMEEKNIPMSRHPDFYLNVYTEEFESNNRNSLGIGVGGTGGNVGVGISGGIPLGGRDFYLQITFDIIDARKDELIWQAVVEAEFDKNASPQVRRAWFERIVAKALKAYPPE